MTLVILNMYIQFINQRAKGKPAT